MIFDAATGHSQTMISDAAVGRKRTDRFPLLNLGMLPFVCRPISAAHAPALLSAEQTSVLRYAVADLVLSYIQGGFCRRQHPFSRLALERQDRPGQLGLPQSEQFDQHVHHAQAAEGLEGLPQWREGRIDSARLPRIAGLRGTHQSRDGIWHRAAENAVEGIRPR